jgi:hypothetical protein
MVKAQFLPKKLEEPLRDSFGANQNLTQEGKLIWTRKINRLAKNDGF